MRPVSKITRVLATCLLLATCLIAAGAAAQGVAVDQATDEQKEQARTHFLAGKEALTNKQVEDALASFQASYNVVASPNSHLMVVKVLIELNRNVEAYTEAELVVVEAEKAALHDEKYAPAGDAAKQLMADLRPSIGMVTVRVWDAPPDATLTVEVAGKSIDRSQWGQPIPVEPGVVTVVLSGQPPKEVNVEAGGNATVEFEAGPSEPVSTEGEVEVDAAGAPFDRRTAAYISGGVGVAGMLLFAIFGGMASSTYSDLEDQCPNKQCAAELAEDADSGQDYQVAANVSLVIGIVGLSAGAGLLIWDLADPDPEEEPADDTTPEVAVGPGSITITGRF